MVLNVLYECFLEMNFCQSLPFCIKVKCLLFLTFFPPLSLWSQVIRKHWTSDAFLIENVIKTDKSPWNMLGFSEIIYFNENAFCWNVPDSSSCKILFICHFQLSQSSFISSHNTLLSLWSTRWDSSKLFHQRYEIRSLEMKTKELILHHSKSVVLTF